MNRCTRIKRYHKHISASTSCNDSKRTTALRSALTFTRNSRHLNGSTCPVLIGGQALGCCVSLCAKGVALKSWLGNSRLERTALLLRAVVGYGGISGLDAVSDAPYRCYLVLC